jgi:hypothetical protein
VDRPVAARQLHIPVGIHLGEGPPGASYRGYPKYGSRLTSAYVLEDVLIRHPRLRVYAMHDGSPLGDDMISMLLAHPQLYVDVAGNNWMLPRRQFHEHLRRLVEAGFAKRIMFDSDAMIWPETVDIAIQTIQAATFLTEEQKRDIFYSNAARFQSGCLDLAQRAGHARAVPLADRAAVPRAQGRTRLGPLRRPHAPRMEPSQRPDRHRFHVARARPSTWKWTRPI